MSTATLPTTVGRPIGDPHGLPDNEWISLATVANACDGHPDNLENMAIRAGIEITRAGRGWGYVRAKDLDALIGPVKARSLRRFGGAEWVLARLAGGLVGVADTEVAALAERRGVSVNRTTVHPMISRGGLIALGKILDWERNVELPDSDWIRGSLILPRMRTAMRTLISGGPGAFGEEIDLTDPNQPREIDQTPREIAWRCRLMGIRYRRESQVKGVRQRSPSGPLFLPKWDLYRLLSIVIDQADAEIYDEWMASAYAAIVGLPSPSPAEAPIA